MEKVDENMDEILTDGIIDINKYNNGIMYNV